MRLGHQTISGEITMRPPLLPPEVASLIRTACLERLEKRPLCPRTTRWRTSCGAHDIRQGVERRHTAGLARRTGQAVRVGLRTAINSKGTIVIHPCPATTTLQNEA